jgi:hypothetical protein
MLFSGVRRSTIVGRFALKATLLLLSTSMAMLPTGPTTQC